MLGPVQEGLAQRMGGAPAPPPQAGPPPGPGGPQMGPPPPGMGMGGGDPMERLANALGEARMAVGEAGPQRFPEAAQLLKGFVGSIARLQESFTGGAQPPQQPGMQPGMPPAPGAPQQMGPPPGPPGMPPPGY